MRVRKIGNSVFYDYPMGLGMPALSYFGMIVDNVNQRISIPIRGSVHTHPDGAGISIDNINARSEDDLISAQMLWDISYFTNFVIEPSGNTYKTGYFDNDEYNKEYFNTRSGLTLEEICQ